LGIAGSGEEFALEIESCLRHLPKADRIPAPDRIAAMALNNGITLVLSDAVRKGKLGSDIDDSIGILKNITRNLRSNDALKLFADEIELLYASVRAVTGSGRADRDSLLLGFGKARVGELVAFCRDFEDDRELYEVLKRAAFEVYPRLEHEALHVEIA
jgi:hypothetical protein